MTDLVLVTGISGFIAKHIALLLLREGYRVRGSVRGLDRTADVKTAILASGGEVARLEFVVADLEGDVGWDMAVAGCRFVVHTASPFPARLPRNRLGLVPAARDGTVRVVEAAARAGAERIVVTSSVAAVQYGRPERGDGPFDESDFSNVEVDAVGPYIISKTLAEQAAWASAAKTGLPLVSINPGLVLGPLMDPRLGTSASIVAMMMKGRLPLVPNIAFAIVDVRDVAKAHVSAMLHKDAPGRRFILSAGTRSMREIADAVAAACPAYRSRMPRGVLPDAAVRLISIVYPPLRQILPELGVRRQLDCSPAVTVLAQSFVTPEDAVGAMAESLRAQGHV